MIVFLLLLAIPILCGYAGFRLFAFAWEGWQEPRLDKSDFIAPLLKAGLGAMLLGIALYGGMLTYSIGMAL